MVKKWKSFIFAKFNYWQFICGNVCTKQIEKMQERALCFCMITKPVHMNIYSNIVIFLLKADKSHFIRSVQVIAKSKSKIYV